MRTELRQFGVISWSVRAVPRRHSDLSGGSRSRSLVRARWSALVSAGTDMSRSLAHSVTGQPSTSRGMTTAR
jgi:hypothetical protein